jgi:hypothetical protein
MGTFRGEFGLFLIPPAATWRGRVADTAPAVSSLQTYQKNGRARQILRVVCSRGCGVGGPQTVQRLGLGTANGLLQCGLNRTNLNRGWFNQWSKIVTAKAKITSGVTVNIFVDE